ncbi:MAG: hypothetical protein ACRC3G_07000, partial [Bacteroidales bacterium]
ADMKKLYLIITLFVVSFTAIFAQQVVPYPGVFSVGGLELGVDYTDEQMREKLGTPTKYFIQNDELGGAREYQYGIYGNHDLFRWSGQDGFNAFALRTKKHALFDDKIRVGDKISIFNTLNFGRLTKKSSTLYYFDFDRLDASLVITTNQEDVIMMLGFSIPM